MRRLILVLGTHRAGTSVVTRSLQCLGVQLGDCLLPPNQFNPRGYFEDQDLVRLNIEILAEARKWCYDLSAPDENRLKELAHGQLGARARYFIEDRFANASLFGFKDPRLCRLLLFWRQIFADCAVNVSAVIVFRNPLDVAQSLYRRDGIRPHIGIKIYEQCYNEIRSGIAADWPTIVVSYERMLKAPGEELSRLAQGLALPTPEVIDVIEFARHFLDESLHHFTPVEGDETLSRPVKDLWRRLDALASVQGPLSSLNSHD